VKHLRLTIFGIIFILGSTLFAHGVDYEIIKGGIGVQVQYDSGQPLAFCDFLVFSPRDAKTAYQQGLTDKYGRFLFIPDTTGNWRVEVDDGMGHGLVEMIPVSSEMTFTKEMESKHLNRYQKILIGVSIIFGITGIGFYFAGKKNTIES